MHAVVTLALLSAAARFAASQDFVKVDCGGETVGLVGQRTVLECRVVFLSEVSDFEIQMVDWKRKREKPPVVLYNAGDKKVVRGYDFADPSWHKKSHGVSLLISNTTVADDGEYVCSVSTDRGDGVGKTSLKARAKYSAPAIRTSKGESSLICESGGGYPRGVLRWFDGSGAELENAAANVTRTESGLFRLRSETPVPPESGLHKFTCAVFAAGGAKESEASFHLSPSKHGFLERGDDDGKVATKVAAPVIVIGSLAVGLLLVLVVLRSKRRARHNHHEVSTDESNVEDGNRGRTDA